MNHKSYIDIIVDYEYFMTVRINNNRWLNLRILCYEKLTIYKKKNNNVEITSKLYN